MDNSTFGLNTSKFGVSGGFCQLKGSLGIAIYVTLLILLAIAATIENLLIIIVILKNEILRTPSLLLLGVLAFIDLVIGCVLTPVKATLALHFQPSLGIAFIWLFLAMVLLALSTVTLISFDRFFYVYFMDEYNFTVLKMLGSLFLSWLGPFLLIVLIASGLKAGLGAGVFALCYFFFCNLAMLVACIAMLITLKFQRNQSEPVADAAIENQKQALKTTFIIIVTFFFMNFLPIVYIALSFMGVFSNELCAVTYFIMLANSAVNPLIYCLRIPRIKEHIILLIYRKNEESANTDEENRQVDPAETGEEANAEGEGVTNDAVSHDDIEMNEAEPAKGENEEQKEAAADNEKEE